jgi:Ca2+/Na+ antiporter
LIHFLLVKRNHYKNIKQNTGGESVCKLEEFIANFIGNASLIILLTIFNKDKKNKLTRSLLIVTILTFVVVLTDFILPPFDILINYGCFFFLVIATYRKDKIKY